MQLLAKTLHGLEGVLAEELRQIGATNVKERKRAVSFEGDLPLMYRANVELRTALRILMPIANFQAKNEEDLYDKIKGIDWEQYMTLKQTLAVDAVTASKTFNHSKYVALKVKDAVVDQFRDKYRKRPNVRVSDPHLGIYIYIYNNDVSVSIDSTGQSLHKRGYRVAQVDAPINEVLAAGLILLSGWNKKTLLMDPMCGSGTILIEAGLYAHHIPPNLNRKHFAFMNWSDFDQAAYDQVIQTAKDQVVEHDFPIKGWDKNLGCIRKTEQNIEAAGLAGKIEVKRKRFENLKPPADNGFLIMNPPYDERLEEDDIKDFYGIIGDTLKKKYSGYNAWLISSNMDAIKSIGLRASKRITLFNGKLECKFLEYELYEGTRKTAESQSQTLSENHPTTE